MERKRGIRYTIIIAFLGLIVAHIVTLAFTDLDHLTLLEEYSEIKGGLIFGLIGLLISSFYFGGWAGHSILIKKENSSVIGIVTCFLVLITILIFVSGSLYLGFGTIEMELKDYVIVTAFYILMCIIVMSIPIIILGIILGLVIENDRAF